MWARNDMHADQFAFDGLDRLRAGIGENRTELREAICANLDQLGSALDPKLNAANKAQEGTISSPNSKVKIMVIPTNEELVVAREVHRFLSM